MKNELKRKFFEEAKWIINADDSYDENPLADKECKTCNGHGVCEDSSCSMVGYLPINCPDCWNK